MMSNEFSNSSKQSKQESGTLIQKKMFEVYGEKSKDKQKYNWLT